MAVAITRKPSSLHCGPNLQIILKCKKISLREVKGQNIENS